MKANEWLEVMKQAADFPKGMEKLIIKYGQMLIEESKPTPQQNSKSCKTCKFNKSRKWCESCNTDYSCYELREQNTQEQPAISEDAERNELLDLKYKPEPMPSAEEVLLTTCALSEYEVYGNPHLTNINLNEAINAMHEYAKLYNSREIDWGKIYGFLIGVYNGKQSANWAFNKIKSEIQKQGGK